MTELRYEDLCIGPERELRRLCDFLGEEFSAETLKHQLAANEVTANLLAGPILRNLDKPLLQDNHTKWSEELTGRQIGLIESVCWSVMQDYDYAHFTSRKSVGFFDHLRRQRHRYSIYVSRRRRIDQLAKHLSAALSF